MNIFIKMANQLNEDISPEDVEAYGEMLKNMEDKALKKLGDVNVYMDQMENPVAKKILKYISGFKLIFDSKQKFTEKTKTFKVRDLDNVREEKALKLAVKYNTEVEYKGSTPTVKIDDYKFIFKNASSVGGNAGHQFERDVSKALNNKDLEDKTVKRIVDELGIDIDDIEEIKDRGAENTRRPISVSSGKIEFKNITDTDQVGDLVSDIDLILKDDDIIHMSLKTSSTVTFINVGLGSAGPNNQKMISVIEALGADPDRCVQGFKDYNNTEADKSVKEDFDANKEDYKQLLKFAMGSNYLYVHSKQVFFIDKAKNEKMISNPKNFKIQYPGPGRKRLDVTFETDGFEKIKINVRPKSGGLWPTHLMCDYKVRKSE